MIKKSLRNLHSWAAILLCGLLISLTGCGTAGDGSDKAAALFSEDEVMASARQVVELANDKEFDKICALIAPAFQDQISPEELEDAWGGQLESGGQFVDFRNSVVSYSADKNFGEYATAVLVVQYENGRLTYTLSFDTNLRLIGLYLK